MLKPEDTLTLRKNTLNFLKPAAAHSVGDKLDPPTPHIPDTTQDHHHKQMIIVLGSIKDMQCRKVQPVPVVTLPIHTAPSETSSSTHAIPIHILNLQKPAAASTLPIPTLNFLMNQHGSFYSDPAITFNAHKTLKQQIKLTTYD